jgi:DNA polymerase
MLRHQFVFMGASRTGRWCLAEGSLVRVKSTDGIISDKPIEMVSATDLVWDGVEWVKHDGVVFSGEKETITWDGIQATPEHEVWISADKKVMLGDARNAGAVLWRGDGR